MGCAASLENSNEELDFSDDTPLDSYSPELVEEIQNKGEPWMDPQFAPVRKSLYDP